jgi:nucleotide-binding universal stress UspA family protein
MFKRLLVPLDGSKLSEASLPIAAYLAQTLGASVMLLHIIERDAPKEIHSDRHLREAGQAKEYLEDVASRAFPPGVSVEVHVHAVGVKDVAQSIADHAEELEPDLIIICTHGSGGARDWIFGSIAQQVVSIWKTPVLLIPPRCCKEEFEFKKILIPLDGLVEHEEGLPVAAELAKTFEAKLYLLMVIHKPGTLKGERAAVRQMLPGAMSALLELEEEQGRKYLRNCLKDLLGQSLKVEAEVRRGEPVATITDAAENLPADLIVLGTHGKTGSDAFWSGSATPKIASRSQIPLLLVPVRE